MQESLFKTSCNIVRKDTLAQVKNSYKEIYFSKVSDLSRQLTSLGRIFQQLFLLQYAEHLSMAAPDSEVF